MAAEEGEDSLLLPTNYGKQLTKKNNVLNHNCICIHRKYDLLPCSFSPKCKDAAVLSSSAAVF